MSRWLYQMSEDAWPVDNYRRQVKERKVLRWPARKVVFAHGRTPSPGDLIVCFYAPSHCRHPGVCGFGLITKYLPKTRRFDWLALPPTDTLKHDPWWDERAEEIADLVRAQSPRGTMYLLPAALDTDLRRGMFVWAGAK